MSPGSRPRLAIAAWVVICVVWGTSYLAIKIALETIPPLLITGIRYAVAGAILAGWVGLRGEGLPSWRAWPGLAVVGLLMLAVGNGLLVAAEQHVPSGIAAVLVATTPFWMVGVDAARGDGEPPSWTHVAGLAVGFAGILLLVWPDLVTADGVSWPVAAGVVGLQVACFAWALGSAIGKRQALATSPVQASAVQMLAAGGAMLLLATLAGEWGAFHLSVRSGLAQLYLTLAASLLGFVAYVYALAHLPMAFVSLYAYINPLVAVGLGAAVAGEPFGVRVAAAVAIILSATALVSRTQTAR